MDLTFFHPSKELGYKTAELIIKMLKENKSGSEITGNKVYNGECWIPASSVESIPITRENIDLLIDKDVYSWDQIRE